MLQLSVSKVTNGQKGEKRQASITLFQIIHFLDLNLRILLIISPFQLYTKLDEKMRAKEAEMNQIQAKTQVLGSSNDRNKLFVYSC